VDIGLVAGAPVLCVDDVDEKPAHIGCWSVDVNTGALTPSAVTSLAGHVRRVMLDDNGCVDGFCVGKPGADDNRGAMIATSTDAAHVVVQPRSGTGHELSVFDARTKRVVTTIDLNDPNAPPETNVANEVWDLIYVGRTIYVQDQQAGPTAGVLSFRDDGTRLGTVGGTNPIAVFGGGLSVLDDGHAGVSTVGLERLVIVAAKDGSTTTVKRTVKRAPCSTEAIELLDTPASGTCARHLEREYLPYVDVKLVALGADYLAALTGKHAGEIVVFNAHLAKKRRLTLKRCKT
ncbi:MAG TPA: hypothetical protein VFS57_01285, partial [Gemmatimonadaceae bacterium]|nr:hypothetical protein [Gemmatimonadaceae bacterium]